MPWRKLLCHECWRAICLRIANLLVTLFTHGEVTVCEHLLLVLHCRPSHWHCSSCYNDDCYRIDWKTSRLIIITVGYCWEMTFALAKELWATYIIFRDFNFLRFVLQNCWNWLSYSNNSHLCTRCKSAPKYYVVGIDKPKYRQWCTRRPSPI